MSQLYTIGILHLPQGSVELILWGPEDYEQAEAEAGAALALADGDISKAYKALRQSDGWRPAHRIGLLGVTDDEEPQP